MPIELATAAEVQELKDEIQRLARIIEAAIIVPEPEWLPISQAAKKLGCDPSTIHRRIGRQQLKVKTVDGRRLVKVTQLP